MDSVRVSKFLSLVLRHKPAEIAIELDDAGWVAIETLLDALQQHGRPVTREQLEAVVAGSDKQRFVIDAAQDRIRANQGHSIEVDLGLPAAEPPPVLYHGTPTRNLASIMASGIDKRARHAVHLSADPETAARVGARRGEHVILQVDSARMHRDGHTFAVSANGVWLTDAVAPQYLSHNFSSSTSAARQ